MSVRLASGAVAREVWHQQMVVGQVWDSVFPVVVATRHAAVDENYCDGCMRMMLAIRWHNYVVIVIHCGRHNAQADM